MSENQYVPYQRKQSEPRQVRYLGDLPADGRWSIHAVPTSAAKDAIVFVDTLGAYEPRVVRNGELHVLKPEFPFAAPKDGD